MQSRTAHRHMHTQWFDPLNLAWICGLLFAILGFSGAPPQAIPANAVSDARIPPDRAPNVIRVSSNLISVPVSVTDARGQAIRDLSIGDFRIAEDGKPVDISKLSDAGRSPLNLALLFDLSGSVLSRFEFEQQAARHFLEKVWRPEDSITLIAFSEEPKLRIRSSRHLAEALQELTRLLPTESATAFFDSVIFAVRLLHQSATPGTRQALVALSDGADNRSDRDMAAALQETQRLDTIFYAINPSGASVRLNAINAKGQEDLAALAAATGGTAFVSDQSSNLDGIFDLIATELRAQYLLSYYSPRTHTDGRFHSIEVSLPHHPDLRIRARQGYLASLR